MHCINWCHVTIFFFIFMSTKLYIHNSIIIIDTNLCEKQLRQQLTTKHDNKQQNLEQISQSVWILRIGNNDNHDDKNCSISLWGTTLRGADVYNTWNTQTWIHPCTAAHRDEETDRRMERREGGSRHNEEFACADEVGQQLLGLGRRQPVKQENPEHPVQVGNLRLVLVRVVDDLRGENTMNIGATLLCCGKRWIA